MVQAKRVVAYCRVSTSDQDCDRQVRDLTAWAERSGYQLVATFVETASGADDDRPERKKLIAMAKAREIDAVLITELTRWGRSTADLIGTLDNLHAWGVSVLAKNGQSFDLSTSTGKLMRSILATLAEFERDLVRERVVSGLAAARAKGVKLGRQVGQNPSDKKATQVMKRRGEGMSIRAIARHLQLSPTTVVAVLKWAAREREAFAGSP